MNVFFTAPLRGKDKYEEQYKQIYKILKKKNKVFAEHLLGKDVDLVHNWDPEYRFEFYQDVIDKIKYCDLLVAELSVSTINVIYEICIAVELKKNVIILYEGKKEPKFIEEIEDSKLIDGRIQVLNYTNGDLERLLTIGLETAKKQVSQRFTILLPTHITNYLEDKSKKNKVPRSVYIRRLIEKDMEGGNG